MSETTCSIEIELKNIEEVKSIFEFFELSRDSNEDKM
jgi:hypothetical protein